MAGITLDQASRIVDAALAEARKQQLAPLSVAVLDAGGQLVAFKREDRSSLLRFEIAFGKAWGAMALGINSREIGARAEAQPSFVNAAALASGGRMVPVPGGVLVLDGGTVIGAVGASGDQSDKDEACVLAGITAAGLTPRG